MMKVGDLVRQAHHDPNEVGVIVDFRIFMGPRGTKFRQALVMWPPSGEVYSCNIQSILPVNS